MAFTFVFMPLSAVVGYLVEFLEVNNISNIQSKLARNLITNITNYILYNGPLVYV